MAAINKCARRDIRKRIIVVVVVVIAETMTGCEEREGSRSEAETVEWRVCSRVEREQTER